MKLLLGSLLLAGVCWLGAAMDFPTMPTFNNQRVAGNWYPLANILIGVRFPPFTLKAKTGQSLTYSFKYRDNNKCNARNFRFTQQGAAGKYKTSSPVFIQILDTDYNTYLITYIARPTTSFLALAGKQNTLTPDLETKFREFATSKGITGEIVPVEPTETC